MSRWFRHYAGMMRDDKLVRAALKSGQPIERVVWVWGAILESAAEIDDDGRFDLDATEVAYFLRAPESDIQGIVDALKAMGRIAKNRVTKWSDRQFQSDRSASRVAAHRKRKRKQVFENDEDFGPLRNGDVTLQKRHGNAPETETETEVTLAKASDAEASSDKAFWAGAVSYLGGNGKRALIGKWCRDHGQAETAKAITAAQVERAVDPVPYIERVLRGSAKAEPVIGI